MKKKKKSKCHWWWETTNTENKLGDSSWSEAGRLEKQAKANTAKVHMGHLQQWLLYKELKLLPAPCSASVGIQSPTSPASSVEGTGNSLIHPPTAYWDHASVKLATYFLLYYPDRLASVGKLPLTLPSLSAPVNNTPSESWFLPQEKKPYKSKSKRRNLPNPEESHSCRRPNYKAEKLGATYLYQSGNFPFVCLCSILLHLITDVSQMFTMLFPYHLKEVHTQHPELRTSYSATPFRISRACQLSYWNSTSSVLAAALTPEPSKLASNIK